MSATTDAVDGRWHVVATSLPFWRKRSRPTITYTPLPDGRILDVVSYRAGGRDKLVLGTDTADGDGWSWRGLTPLTRLTTSRWRVVAVDESGEEPGDRWAVTAFEKTLFTPAGVDVYCRAESISPEARSRAMAAIQQDPSVRPFLDAVFDTRR